MRETTPNRLYEDHSLTHSHDTRRFTTVPSLTGTVSVRLIGATRAVFVVPQWKVGGEIDRTALEMRRVPNQCSLGLNPRLSSYFGVTAAAAVTVIVMMSRNL